MTEYPILFQDRLVRAILEDRKMQTRRLVKPALPDEFRPLAVERFPQTVVNKRTGQEEPGPEVFGCYDEDQGRRCPYGGPGDRLWVREAWMPLPHTEVARLRSGGMTPGPWNAQAGGILYRATAMNPAFDYLAAAGHRWKPSIHLPRKAARLLLEISEVRVQRLQDLTDEDAIAEGVMTLQPGIGRRRLNYFHAARGA